MQEIAPSFSVLVHRRASGISKRIRSPGPRSTQPAPWLPGAVTGRGALPPSPGSPEPERSSHPPVRVAAAAQGAVLLVSNPTVVFFNLRKSFFFFPFFFFFFSIALLCKARGGRWREAAKSKAAAKVCCEEQGWSKDWDEQYEKCKIR